MKRKIIAVFMCLIIIFSIVGCGDSKNDKGLEEVTVVLDWYPNAVHGFIYTAMKKGYYEEEGLKVNIQFPSNVNDALSLTSAGKADIGFYYLQDIALAKGNEDVPVKVVGTVVQAPLNIILSLKDKNINEPKDLVGKKIGYAGTALSEEIIKYMLEHSGEDVKSVETVDVGFDLMSSMTTGNVDATIGCMVNHEVPQLEDEGFEVNYFYPNDYGIPNYYELVLVAGEKNLNKNSDKISKFLRASKKGFEDMKNDPEESLKILLDNQNEENFPLTESVERKSFDTLIPLMETEDAEFLSQDEEVWQNNIDWLKEVGLLKKSFDAKEILVDLDY